ARPGEEVRMVQPSRAQGLRQRLGDVLLADDLGERARSVFSVERERHLRILRPPGLCGWAGTTLLPTTHILATQGAPRAPVRAHLSLLPSGPGEVHEVHAARGAGSDNTRCAAARAGGYPLLRRIRLEA